MYLQKLEFLISIQMQLVHLPGLCFDFLVILDVVCCYLLLFL